MNAPTLAGALYILFPVLFLALAPLAVDTVDVLTRAYAAIRVACRLETHPTLIRYAIIACDVYCNAPRYATQCLYLVCVAAISVADTIASNHHTLR